MVQSVQSGAWTGPGLQHAVQSAWLSWTDQSSGQRGLDGLQATQAPELHTNILCNISIYKASATIYHLPFAYPRPVPPELSSPYTAAELCPTLRLRGISGGDCIWFSPRITSAFYYVSLDCRPTQSTEIWTRPSSPPGIPDWVIAVHQKEWTGLDHRRPSSPSGSPPWPVKNTAFRMSEWCLIVRR
jgi:hypothetical protein